MTRTLTLAVLAALAGPAFAGDTPDKYPEIGAV